MNIRKATKSDFEIINSLSNELGYKKQSKEIVFKRLENILNSSIDNLFVYENEDKIKGWIHFFIANRVASESFVEIGGLVVDLTARREGIGKSLVEFVKQWARTNNYEIRVRCNTKRENTHKFYETLHFENKKSQYVFQMVF